MAHLRSAQYPQYNYCKFYFKYASVHTHRAETEKQHGESLEAFAATEFNEFSRADRHIQRWFSDVSGANCVPIFRVCWWFGRTKTILGRSERGLR